MSGGKYGELFRSNAAAAGAGERDGGAPPPRPRGRRNRKKTGKRSDPDYRQVTAYVRVETHELVRYALIGKTNERGKKLEFSELVDSLLQDYAEREGWSVEDLRDARG